MPAVLEGMSKFNGKMSALVDAADDRQLRRALMQGGLVFERGMKVRITELDLIETGAMRAGVAAEPDPRSTVDVLVGPDVFYAIFHELGTIYIPARPFVRPTFDEDSPAALAAIERYLKIQIEGVAK